MPQVRSSHDYRPKAFILLLCWGSFYLEIRSDPDSEILGCGLPPHSDLHVTRASLNQKGFSGGCVRIRGRANANLTICNMNNRSRGELVDPEVGDHVAEPVDVKHLSPNRFIQRDPVPNARTNGFESCSHRQSRRDRSEHITSVKGRADWMPEVIVVRYVADNNRRTEATRQKSVVGTDEEQVPIRCRDWPPVRPHTRIHDCKMDSSRREMPDPRAQYKRAFPDTVPLDAVADVHQPGVRGNAQQDPLHHANPGVAIAKVRGERDYHGDKIAIPRVLDLVRRTEKVRQP